MSLGNLCTVFNWYTLIYSYVIWMFHNALVQTSAVNSISLGGASVVPGIGPGLIDRVPLTVTVSGLVSARMCFLFRIYLYLFLFPFAFHILGKPPFLSSFLQFRME